MAGIAILATAPSSLPLDSQGTLALPLLAVAWLLMPLVCNCVQSFSSIVLSLTVLTS